MPSERPANPGDTRRVATRREDLLLWFGVLAPPVAWALRLMTAYLLVYVACATGTTLPIHLVSLATALLSIAGGVAAWRSWRRLTGGERSLLAGPRSRPEFMAITGIIFGAYFLALILLEWSPAFVLDPCLSGL